MAGMIGLKNGLEIEMDYSLLGNVVIPGLSLVVALGTACFVWKDRRHARYQMESNYIDNLLSWHKEVVSLLVCMEHGFTAQEKAVKSANLATLSSLIEQGRFFFPNINKDGFGSHKPLAYRGYRNVMLDLLVAIYQIHLSASGGANKLELYRKTFTSGVYSLVDPIARLSELSSITQKNLNPGQTIHEYVSAEWK